MIKIHRIFSSAIAPILIAAILCVSLSGCKPSPEETAPSPEPSSEPAANMTGSDEPKDAKEYYFDENGIRHVRLYSEDITASYEFYSGWYDPDENPRFKELVPLEKDIPQDKLGKKAEGKAEIERDWQDFEHRLEQVNYNLKVHYSLEPEIDEIVYRLLVIDDVIPIDSEMPYDDEVTWLNTDIFDRFVDGNVHVEIIGEDSDADYTELTSDLSWQVYSGGCYPKLGANDDETVCGQHLFNVWLIGFSGTDVTVWDMKYVEEPGCGDLLPMYKA